jgi:cyclase
VGAYDPCMALGTHPFVKGITELSDGAYAWLAPDGSWGWSNAGLVVDGDESLVIDTLFDLALTREMLDAMQVVEPEATAHVDMLVNTHANGDHCHGNELVPTYRIIASQATAEEMDDLPPAALAAMMTLVDADVSALGQYLRHAFGAFEFNGIVPTPPTETFSGTAGLTVGDKTVELIEVGPAHTRGDVIVHVPADGVVFTGDILFIEGTPIMWEGPVDNWIAACETIARLGAPLVVPGHGPITDIAGVTAVADYWRLLRDETRARFESGMTVSDAARDIDLGPFVEWGESERVLINVNTLYREFGSDAVIEDIVAVFAEMGELWLQNG